MSLFEICQWIQSSEYGVRIHESLIFFPLMMTIHVLALALSVGTVFWFDLRAMGIAMQEQPVSKVFAAVRPWMLTGFVVMFITGAFMFWAHAADNYMNPFFRIKVAGLVLTALNAAYFHFKTQHGMAGWDRAPIPPVAVRLAGLFSVVLWVMIIAAGRLMAYAFALSG